MFKDTIKKIITFQSKGLLGFVSFIESIFFPIPTDVLLIPMCFARPHEWKILAFITTITSVLGGIFGFYLGSLLFPEIYPYIISMGYEDEFDSAKSLFITHGAIILLISSFTPLPYKIFTLVAGFLSIDIFNGCSPSPYITDGIFTAAITFFAPFLPVSALILTSKVVCLLIM